MTLKGHYAVCIKTRAFLGAHHENLNEDRLYAVSLRQHGFLVSFAVVAVVVVIRLKEFFHQQYAVVCPWLDSIVGEVV